MKIRNFVLVGLLALVFVLLPASPFGGPVVTNAQTPTIQQLQQTITRLRAQLNVLLKQRARPQSLASVATSSITVIFPNGGERWIKGEEHIVSWQEENIPLNVGLEIIFRYFPNGNPSSVIYYDYLEAHYPSGLEAWSFNTGTTTAGCLSGDIFSRTTNKFCYVPGVYTLKVKTNEGNIMAEDWSDSYFTIVAPISTAPLAVFFPNGGEVWPLNGSQTVRWNTPNLLPADAQMQVELIPVAGATTQCPNRAMMPTTPNSFGQAGVSVNIEPFCRGQYLARVGTWQSGIFVSDSSDNPFTVGIPTIISSSPPNGAIDARHGSNEGYPSGQGEDLLDFMFRMPSGQFPNDFPTSAFSVSSTRAEPIALARLRNITELEVPSGQINLQPIFSRRIFAGERFRITHKPSNSSICLGFLPGDVNGDGTTAPADQLDLIDALNGRKTLPIYSTDIDRSGLAAPADIFALTDLLNAGWNGKTLPPCPPATTGLSPTSQSQFANTLSALSAALRNLQNSLGR